MNERTKHIVFYIVMALVVLPFFFWVKIPPVFNQITISLYLAILTGFLGTALLLIEFVLGTRTISAKLFNDLAWTTHLHKNLGKYGSILILMHPVLITYSYGEKWFYSLIPNFKDSFEWYVSWGRFSFIALAIIWVTSALVRGKIAFRPWKYVHYLSYIALPLVFIHSPPIGTAFSASSVLLAYWYTLAVVYLVLLVLRMRHIFGFSKYRFQVLSNKQLTDDVWLLRLSPLERNMRINKGQYVYLQRSLTAEEHPFSILGYDEPTNELLIAYKVFGSYTEKLTRLEANESVLLDGPYGTFTNEDVRDSSLPSVFIAGGIGITPFVSHIFSAEGENLPYLFYANSSKKSRLLGHNLRTKLGNRYVDIISGEDASREANTERGYISEEILEKYLPEPSRFNYFVCGPDGMMQSAKVILMNMGVAKEQIFSEEFTY